LCARGQIAREGENHGEDVVAHFGQMHAARVRDPYAVGQSGDGPERIGSGAERLKELEARRARPVDARGDAAEEDARFAEACLEIVLAEKHDVASVRAHALGDFALERLAAEPGVERVDP